MPIVVRCPACQKQLRVPDHLLGQNVRCPSCQEIFLGSVEAEDVPVAPLVAEEELPSGAPRPSIRRREEDFEEQPARPRRRAIQSPDEDVSDDEYDDSRPSRRRAIYREGGPKRLSNRYSIDLGEWFQHARDNWGAVLGPMIGFMLIHFAIGAALTFIPLVGPLANLFIQPPLWAGYTIVCLAQLKGKSWSFGDFFSGFQRYGSLLANALLMALIGFVCMLPTIIRLIAVGVAAGLMKNPSLLLWVIIIGVLNFGAAVYFGLRLACFNVQLIIDRGFGPIDAIQGSWNLSRGHFWGLFGAFLVFGLLAVSGFLLCGIGVWFTAPLAMLGINAGYLLIAGARGPRRRRPISAGAGDEGDY